MDKECFKDNKYVLAEQLIDEDMSNIINNYCLFKEKNEYSPEPITDAQVANAHSFYADPIMESLLVSLLPKIEKFTGLELYPTYSYYRVYRKDNVLFPHRDRPSCEITVSLCLGYSYPEGYDGWPLIIENEGFIMDRGDAIIYRGMELLHSRNTFDVSSEDSYLSQVFLHYVDKNGPNSSFKFDRRKRIG